MARPQSPHTSMNNPVHLKVLKGPVMTGLLDKDELVIDTLAASAADHVLCAFGEGATLPAAEAEALRVHMHWLFHVAHEAARFCGVSADIQQTGLPEASLERVVELESAARGIAIATYVLFSVEVPRSGSSTYVDWAFRWPAKLDSLGYGDGSFVLANLQSEVALSMPTDSNNPVAWLLHVQTLAKALLCALDWVLAHRRPVRRDLAAVLRYLHCWLAQLCGGAVVVGSLL